MSQTINFFRLRAALCRVILPAICLLNTGFSYAQPDDAVSNDLKLEINKHFLTVQELLDSDSASAQELEQLVAQTGEYRSASESCSRSYSQKLAAKKKEIKTLKALSTDAADSESDTAKTVPTADDAEPPELVELRKDRDKFEKRLVDCQVLTQQTDKLQEELTTRYNSLVISGLRLRDDNAFVVFRQLSAESREVWQVLQGASRNVFSGEFWNFRNNVAAALIFVVGILTAALLRSRIRAGLPAAASKDMAGNFWPAALLTLRKHAFFLIPFALVAAFIFITGPTIRNLPLPVVLCYSAAGLAAALYVIQLLLQPPAPAQAIVPVETGIAAAVRNRLNILAFLIFGGLFLYLFFLPLAIPPVLIDAAHIAAITLLTTNLVWLFWLVNRIKSSSQGSGNSIRWLMMSILTVALFAEYLGYHNFAEFLLTGFVGTLLALFLLWLFNQLTQEVLDGLDTGTREWHKKVRDRLGIAEDASIPGLIWFRLLATLAVWALAVFVFFKSWGMSSNAGVWLNRYVVDGFTVGETTIIPVNLLIGIAVFAVILLLAGRIKKQLGERSRLLARFDPAAKETVVTLTGYAGVVVALLFGMSLAGFGFGNLAIIAGALSVGIGFGMQNIVNNFVSGIILLFERPIRKGDWVIVGDTEGEVTNINVRATQVLTLDRYEIVIPNSEFISSQVINCSLADPYVRLLIPVGVAYGSDTELVKRLLEQAAREHPEVVKDHPKKTISDPVIQFVGFGDSSLDFVVRCFIRAARRKPFVTSDLNFSIDSLFREHNVEIPFPQRDIHLRSSAIDLK